MKSITERLFELRDEKYASFQAKLTPTIDPSTIIGVRVPLLRKLAKEIWNTSEAKRFIHSLPHKYYDENMLHGFILAEFKDFDECLGEVNDFLSFVDNWAVCDTMSPKVFRKHKEELLPVIRKWAKSKDTYRCRFAIGMLMSHFLDEDFKEEYLEIPALVKSDEYYVSMMIAWFFATALAKKWDSAIKYIEEKRLDPWTHNKAIQKARESFRISDKQKEYLKTLKS